MTATPPTLRLCSLSLIGLLLAALAVGWLVAARLGGDSLVEVPVTDAALVWHPGVNSGGPDLRSSARGVVATHLAELVNGTREVPGGPVHCPADFGSQVQVTFHAAREHDQHVTISLTGCAGPTGRVMSEALREDLERLAPPGFWPDHVR